MKLTHLIFTHQLLNGYPITIQNAISSGVTEESEALVLLICGLSARKNLRVKAFLSII